MIRSVILSALLVGLVLNSGCSAAVAPTSTPVPQTSAAVALPTPDVQAAINSPVQATVVAMAVPISVTATAQAQPTALPLVRPTSTPEHSWVLLVDWPLALRADVYTLVTGAQMASDSAAMREIRAAGLAVDLKRGDQLEFLDRFEDRYHVRVLTGAAAGATGYLFDKTVQQAR